MVLRLVSLAILGYLLLHAAPARADCELVSNAEAQMLLGADVTDVTGADAATQCYFLSNETSSSFIVQISDRGYFEVATLQQPFDTVAIGDEGRARAEDHGGASVQFLKGDNSVMMTVRPTQPGDRDYLSILLEIAARVADRL
jgi:hypothetical protein